MVCNVTYREYFGAVWPQNTMIRQYYENCDRWVDAFENTHIYIYIYIES